MINLFIKFLSIRNRVLITDDYNQIKEIFLSKSHNKISSISSNRPNTNLNNLSFYTYIIFSLFIVEYLDIVFPLEITQSRERKRVLVLSVPAFRNSD